MKRFWLSILSGATLIAFEKVVSMMISMQERRDRKGLREVAEEVLIDLERAKAAEAEQLARIRAEAVEQYRQQVMAEYGARMAAQGYSFPGQQMSTVPQEEEKEEEKHEEVPAA